MSLLSIMLPLTTIYKKFEDLRFAMIGETEMYVSLGMAIASFFVVVYMLRLTYSLSSDERGSGFGGIRLMDIARPVILLVLIGSYPTVLGAVDNLFTRITDSIMAQSKVEDVDIGKVFDAISDSEQLSVNGVTVGSGNRLHRLDSLNREVNSAVMGNPQAKKEKKQEERRLKEEARSANVNSGVLPTQEEKNRYWDLTSAYNSMGSLEWSATSPERTNEYWLNDDQKAEVETLREKMRRDEEFDEKFEKLLRQYFKAEKKLKGSNMFHAITEFIYNAIYAIIQAFAELYLCVLGVFGIFAFAFSVVETWKGAAKSWIGKYVEVSFWKVTAAIIMSVTQMSKQTILGGLKGDISNVYDMMLSGNLDTALSTDISTANGVMWACDLMSIAAIIALFSVPMITNAALNLIGGAAMGGANTGGAFAGSVAKGEHAGKVAGSAMTTIRTFKK